MADAATIAPIPPQPAPPQLPNTVQINTPTVQPGNNSGPAPLVALSQPPNVNGGNADFSTVTSAIQQLVQAKQSELSAGADALTANTAIDRSAATAISGFQQNTIDAFGNIQKAEQLPGGAGGKLAKIIGLFDSDYNNSYQQTSIEANQARAASISASAAILKEQNNDLPLLLGKVSDAANQVLQGQLEANKLLVSQGQLEVDRSRAFTEMQHLKLDMNADQRAQTEFALKGMSTADVTNQLALAQQGKGAWKGKAGFLESRLLEQQTAVANMQTAQDAAAKNNRDEYNNSLSDAVSHMPTDIIQSMYKDAQSKGQAFLALPTGQDDPVTKKPIMQNVPLDLVAQGMLKSAKMEQDANTEIGADEYQRLSIGPKLTNLANTASAFASLDPRAGQLMTQVGSVAQNLNPKDPNNIRQSSLLVDNITAAKDQMVKEQAAKMGSPEAKAAVLAYGQNAKFDAVGGTSVVADSLGIPALNRSALYGSAFQQLNTLLASAVAKQHLNSGASASLDPSNVADQSQIFASILQRGGKEKIAQIGTEIMSDPTNFADTTDKDPKTGKTVPVPGVSSLIKGIIQGRSIQNIVTGLASQKGASPFWQSLLQHPEQMRNAQGKPDAQALFNTLEQQTVTSGGKVNYADQFLNALQNYAVNADNSSASDPAYTMQDRALEAAIFGGSPNQSVLGDLHYKLRMMANGIHQQMQQRIQQDVTGATQRQAIQQHAVMTGLNVAELGLLNPEQLFKKTGIDLNSVPSATGVPGMTAAQIAAQYGSGK